MKRTIQIVCVVVAVGLGSAAMALEIETVPVGNPGNAGELSGSGAGAGGHGTDRICGAVNYEYNIGAYEVTAGQYTEFLNKVAGVDAYGLYNTYMWNVHGCKIERYAGSGTGGDPYQYRVDANWANRPVNYVNWGDAARFANWLHNGQPAGAQDATTTEDGTYYLNGATSTTPLLAVSVPDAAQRAVWAGGSKRYVLLPSEDEWYKAAYYDPSLNSGVGGYYDYPTNSDSVPGYITDSGNFSGTSDPFTEGGVDPGAYATFDGDDFADGIGSPYWRTNVGEHENSESPYGTFDQGGNVYERTDTIIDESYCVSRGGSISGVTGYDIAFALHAAWRGRGNLQIENAYIGFRVSEVPEPATLSLLALGGLALVRRRRR